MLQSNQPIQRINRQEDNNSTLYRNIAMHVGTGVAFQAGQEVILHTMYRKAKDPAVKESLHTALYVDSTVEKMGIVNPITGTDYYAKLKDGKLKRAIGKISVFGQSTWKGRALGYGMAIGGGILSGALQTKATEK